MLTPGIVQKLESDSDWKYLALHIEENIDSLNSLNDIDFSDKEKAAIEGRARVLAKDILIAILEPFGGAAESTDDDKIHVEEKTGVV